MAWILLSVTTSMVATFPAERSTDVAGESIADMVATWVAGVVSCATAIEEEKTEEEIAEEEMAVEAASPIPIEPLMNRASDGTVRRSTVRINPGIFVATESALARVITIR